MASDSPTDQQEAGFLPIEVVLSGLIMLISFVGIAFNTSLVYMTVKTKSLHSQCNVLIALYAFFAIFMYVGNCVKFFIFLLGFDFVTLKACFYIQFINLSATAFAIMLQLCIGLDRLAGVTFPIWYRTKGKYSTFKFLILLCMTKVVVDKCITFYGSSKHWETLVRCDLADPLITPEIIDYTKNNTLFTIVAEISCYALIWLISLCRNAQVTEIGRRLLRTLSLIMSINFIFYATDSLFGIFVCPSLDDFTVSHIVGPISYLIYVLGHCSTVPVLLICSKEYRGAFRAIFLPDRITVLRNMQPQLIIHRSTTNSLERGG